MFHVVLPDPKNLPADLCKSNHWILWRAEVRGEKVSKVPCDRVGRTASMKEGHSSLADALRDARTIRAKLSECYSVGYAFSAGCGIIGVDLDKAIGSEHLQWFTKQQPTWGEVSLSGLGAHLFYRGDFDGKRSISIDGAAIEIFGTRGFIAITGQRIDGTPAEMSAYDPDPLTPYLLKNKPCSSPCSSQIKVHSAFGAAILKEDCDKILASVDGQKHYVLRDAAFHCGHFVPACYSFSEAETALRGAIAQRGCNDMKLAWHTIHTGLRLGAEKPESPPPLPTVDLSGFGEPVEEEDMPRGKDDPSPFPSHLLAVPGLIAQAMEFTRLRSFVDQPVLALAGAIALMAVLCGRKVCDASGTRTSAYLIGVAKTGAGKDAARKSNKEILYAAGADRLIGPEGLASSAGLVQSMEEKQVALFQLDEIGRLLATTTNPTGNSHLYNIITELLKFYTSADSVYLGNAYADSSRNKTIIQPCVVVYGTTVPETLYEAFTPESVSSGWLGRVLVFEAPDQRPAKQTPAVVKPIEDLIARVRAWSEFLPGGDLASAHPRPLVVPSDADANDKINEFDRYTDEQADKQGPAIGCLWVRATEKARKLALIHACSRCGPGEARIDLEAANWACELTDYLTRRLCCIAAANIAENATESTIMRIEKIIIETGEKGITLKQLYDKTRWATKRDRQDVLEHLTVSRRIRSETRATTKRPATVYFSL